MTDFLFTWGSCPASSLAEAYEQAGMYDKAIVYYGMSGKNMDKKISELKEKIADTLLQRAEKSAERGDQEAYLKAILDDFPESAAAIPRV